MSWFSKLFSGGGGAATKPEVIEYQGFRIIPQPVNEGGQFRIGARIEHGSDSETRVHEMIRADMIRDYEGAVEASVFKAKQMIDQLGVRLFD